MPQVALELVAGAEEASLKDDELVGVVLAVAILLAAARSTLSFVREERRKKFETGVVRRAETAWEPASGKSREAYVLDCVKRERERKVREEKSCWLMAGLRRELRCPTAATRSKIGSHGRRR